MNPIQQGLCFAIEAGLNQLIPYDVGYKDKWQDLENKTIALNIKDIQTRFCVRYQSNVFSVVVSDDTEADVTLTGYSWDFFKVAIESQTNEAAAMNSDIHFEGQVALGQKFANSLQSLDIDWEEILSEPVGDIMARRTIQVLKTGASFIDSLAKTSMTNFTEFVQEEARVTPSQIEVENFYQDLRVLRSDVERLNARINRLAALRANPD